MRISRICSCQTKSRALVCRKMRVKFSIETPDVPEKAWMIVIEGAGRQWRREMVRRDDGSGGLLPFPPPDTPATGLALQEPAAVLKAYLAIVGRKAETI